MKSTLIATTTAAALAILASASEIRADIVSSFIPAPSQAAPNAQVQLELTISDDEFPTPLPGYCDGCFFSYEGFEGNVTISDGQGNSSSFFVSGNFDQTQAIVFDTMYATPGDYLATYTGTVEEIGTVVWECVPGVPGSSTIGCPPPGITVFIRNAISGSADITVATPLPAALPLFAAGLSALALLGRRRKRKSSVPISA